MRVGLVLGAGGVTGLAYHAGALAALERELGWDPRTSDIVSGTSAGSVTGALLRRGVSAADMALIAEGREPQSSPEGIARALRQRPEVPPVTLWSLVGRPRLPTPALVGTWLRRPWRVDPITALVSVLPDGQLDLVEHASALDEILGSPWPDDTLWICAVRHNDLRRVVLGRDLRSRLSAAVAASCAIPGYFRPVQIGRRAYIDGGVRSPTNADVLRRAPLDLAIIVSPMSGRDLGRFGASNAVRRHARGKLAGERRRLDAAGIPSVVIEPGPEVVEAIGVDFMSHARTADIVAAAMKDTAEQAQAPVVRTLLAGLVDETRREAAAPGRRRRARRPDRRPGRRPLR